MIKTVGLGKRDRRTGLLRPTTGRPGLLVLALLVLAWPVAAQYNQLNSPYNSMNSQYGSQYGNQYGNQFGSSTTGSRFNRDYGSSRSSRGGYNQGDSYANQRDYSSSERSTSRRTRTGRYREDQSTDNASSRRNRRAGKDATTNATGATGTTGQGGTPDRARLQGKSTVVKRKDGKASNKGGGGGGAPLPEIKIAPDQIDDVVYFTPSSMRVQPGDQFATTLTFFKSKDNKIDQMDLWAHYDPAVIEPVWVDPAPVKKLIAEEPDVQVWREQGYLRIKGALGKSFPTAVNPIATVHWRALKAAPESRLELKAPQGEKLALFSGTQNVLDPGEKGQPLQYSAVVRVMAEDQGDEPGEMRMVSDVTEALAPPPSALKKRLRLVILPMTQTVAPDDQSVADVMLYNPSGLKFDRLRFRIRFDPTAVKILDADVDNYITKGVNIYDGQFHPQFPFDFHEVNQVDSARGIIDYHVGHVEGPAVYPSGTVARIVYKALTPARRAVFWFELVDPVSGERATDVTSYGQSLLGESTGLAREALNGAEVAVREVAPAGS